MNKTDLIEKIAKDANVSKVTASRVVDCLITTVTRQLKRGGVVAMVGFGTFSATKRAARIGRNPRTGAVIKIKAAKVPKFRPGKYLKDALN